MDTSKSATSGSKRVWQKPAIEDLPPLRDLTLQSPIEGGEGGFGWLDLTRPETRNV